MKVRWSVIGQLNPKRAAAARSAFVHAMEGLGARLTLAATASVAASAAEIFRPWPIQWIVDDVLLRGQIGSPGTSNLLMMAIGALFISGLVGGLGAAASLVWAAEAGRKATTRIRRRMFEHIHHLPWGRFSRFESGDLMMRILGDVNMVRDLLFGTWLALTGPVLMFVGTTLLLFLLDFRLALLALVPLPFLIISVRHSSRKMRALTRRQREKEGESAGLLAQSLRQIRVLKAFGAVDRITRRFTRDARSAERAGAKSARLGAQNLLVSHLLTAGGLALFVGVGVFSVNAGRLSTGELLVAVTYARSLYKPLRKLSSESAKLAKATACAERLLNILEEPREDLKSGRSDVRLESNLEFRDLNFTYHDGTTVFKHLNASIRAFKRTVLEGENGAGKSTILGLILGFLKAPAGTILVDGVDLAEIQLESWRRNIAYVPQDVQLFSGTLRDNLLLGAPLTDDTQIIATLSECDAAEWFRRLPEGLDTEMGEGGVNVSGGEARRIMLARALLSGAEFLLLDEPLAGVDPAARPRLARTIVQVTAEKTALIITHDAAESFSPHVRLCLTHGQLETVSRSAAVAGGTP